MLENIKNTTKISRAQGSKKELQMLEKQQGM
jgi:hypothetical protein